MSHSKDQCSCGRFFIGCSAIPETELTAAFIRLRKMPTEVTGPVHPRDARVGVSTSAVRGRDMTGEFLAMPNARDYEKCLSYPASCMHL